MIKRAFDLLVALLALIVLGPLLGLLVALVRLDSPGPGIFRQARVGRFERPFVCYKLRTMRTGTRNAPSHEVGQAALTRLGGVLRRTKLDELPQLCNVVRGQMSFVGPRPCLPSQTELIAARRERGVFEIRPGITGIAQVAGVDMSEPERLAELDARYLATRSLRTDIGLIARTALGAGGGDRVAPPASGAGGSARGER